MAYKSDKACAAAICPKTNGSSRNARKWSTDWTNSLPSGGFSTAPSSSLVKRSGLAKRSGVSVRWQAGQRVGQHLRRHLGAASAAPHRCVGIGLHPQVGVHPHPITVDAVLQPEDLSSLHRDAVSPGYGTSVPQPQDDQRIALWLPWLQMAARSRPGGGCRPTARRTRTAQTPAFGRGPPSNEAQSPAAKIRGWLMLRSSWRDTDAAATGRRPLRRPPGTLVPRPWWPIELSRPRYGCRLKGPGGRHPQWSRSRRKSVRSRPLPTRWRTARRASAGAVAIGSGVSETSTRRNCPANRTDNASANSTPAGPAPTTATRAPGEAQPPSGAAARGTRRSV